MARTGEKIFDCKIWTNTFFNIRIWNSTWGQFMVTTGEKTFQCETWTNTCFQYTYLKQHMRSIHGHIFSKYTFETALVVNSLKVLVKKFYCDHCPGKTRRRGGWDNIYDIGGGASERPSSCAEFSWIFNLLAGLIKHKKNEGLARYLTLVMDALSYWGNMAHWKLRGATRLLKVWCNWLGSTLGVF